MTVALTGVCDHGRRGDWTSAAWRTWAALAEHAPWLALEGWSERHTKQFEHSAPMYSIEFCCVAIVVTYGGTACKLCYRGNGMQAK